MRKWLAYIGIIVALVVGYDYLYSTQSTTSVSVAPTATAPSVPATPLSGSSWAFTIQPWMWVLGILLLIGLVIWNRRALFNAPVPAAGAGISISLPKTGSLPAQLLTSFLVFALVLYALRGVSPNADLFTTAEGWGTIAIYCVAMTAAALAAVNFKGWAKLTPVIGLFIFFSLTGFHTWMLLNSDGVFEKRTHVAGWLSSWRGGTGSTKVVCTGVYEKLELTNKLEPINHGADCNAAWEVKWGKIRVTTITGIPIEVSAGQAVDQRYRFVSWQAADGNVAIVHAAFCPKGTFWNSKNCS